MQLNGRRVRLRTAREDDDPRIVEACNDPETVRWLGQIPQPYGPAEAVEWREHIHAEAAAGQRIGWIIADRETDVLLGALDLFSVRPGWDAEFGYWAHPDARGRGLVTEASQMLVRHAFLPVEQGGVGLIRLQAIAAVGNQASASVLLRVGMRHAGVYRAFALTRAGRVDADLYDVLVDDVRSSGQL